MTAAAAARLRTRLAGHELASPLLVAAGCGGIGRELAGHLDLATLGAFTTRSIRLDASPGAASPRLVETASGLLQSTGRPQPGVLGFLSGELPWLAQQRLRTVVSVVGSTLGEYAEVARRVVTGPGVLGLELNLVSPNRERDGRSFAEDAYSVGKVVAAVRGEVPRGVAVLAKLAPGPGLADRARAAHEKGADAVVLVHGFPGLAIDPGTGRPALGAGTGWVGGPAVLPLALRCVWDVHAQAPEVPLVGVGGVSSATDVVAMLLAGASAVQVGTALLGDPGVLRRIHADLPDALRRRHALTPADLVGAAHEYPDEHPDQHQETP